MNQHLNGLKQCAGFKTQVGLAAKHVVHESVVRIRVIPGLEEAAEKDHAQRGAVLRTRIETNNSCQE